MLRSWNVNRRSGLVVSLVLVGWGLLAGSVLTGCASSPELVTQSSLPRRTSLPLPAGVRAVPPGDLVIGEVERLDPRFDALVPPDRAIEVIAEGFEWCEGPVWVPDADGVLFSDIPRNMVFCQEDHGQLWVCFHPSGYTGETPRGGEVGSNGLLLDPWGRLVLCQHGDRRVARHDGEGRFEPLAERYQGRRLNSPNDAVFDARGNLYFTDPPYGLEKQADDPARELDFCGVFLRRPGGEVELLTRELSRPNGIGLSPDGKTLYVANSDPQRAIWMAYPVEDDGTIGEGRVLLDVTDRVGKRKGLPDGLAVTEDGYLFATGPGGVLVLAPDGTHLGTLLTGQATSNCAFGGEDGNALFITADRYVCRVDTATRGARQ